MNFTHLVATFGYWAALVFVAIQCAGSPFPEARSSSLQPCMPDHPQVSSDADHSCCRCGLDPGKSARLLAGIQWRVSSSDSLWSLSAPG